MNKNIPAISIIIPMYNAEKYIGDALDSILNQTFQDFEVIVVDNASTDNSAAVAEGYESKFASEKFQLIRRKINSGSAGIPTNTGLKFAIGEYLFIMDSDDAITETALEELYSLAQNFDAEVVACERIYSIPEEIWDTCDKKSIPPTGYAGYEFTREPVWASEDFAQRVVDLQQRKFPLTWALWAKLIRRDFWLKNDIKLIDGMASDMLATCSLIYSAKKYLRVPNVINLVRSRKNSESHRIENTSRTLQKWIPTLINGWLYLENFLSEQEFSKNRTDLKYVAQEIWVRECCNYLLGIYSQIPAFQLDSLIREEFDEAGDWSSMITFLFSRMNIFNVNVLQQQQIIQRQQQQIQQLQAQLQQSQGLFRFNNEDIFKSNQG